MDDHSDRRQEDQENDSHESEDEAEAPAEGTPQLTETARLLNDHDIDDAIKNRIMSERASERQTGAKVRPR